MVQDSADELGFGVERDTTTTATTTTTELKKPLER